VATFARGDREAAHRHLEQAIVGAGGIDKVTALNSLALVLAVEGDPGRAARLFEEALALSRSLGSISQTAATLNNLARTRMLANEHAAAHANVLEALELSEAASLIATRQGVLDIVSGLAAAGGEFERAARFWGAGEALLERIGAHRDVLNRRVEHPLMTRAREVLGEAGYAAAHDAGRRLADAAAAAEARAWLTRSATRAGLATSGGRG
jgi:tetratricopeptide (TPR) repeat protein